VFLHAWSCCSRWPLRRLQPRIRTLLAHGVERFARTLDEATPEVFVHERPLIMS